MPSLRSLVATLTDAVRAALSDSAPHWSRWIFLDLTGRAAEVVDHGARRRRGLLQAPRGEGNRVVFGRGSRFRGTVTITGSGNLVEFGDDCRFRGRIRVEGDGQTVRFGAGSTAGDVYILCAEGCDVIIGRACMISREVEIRTSDAHSVVDRATGRRLNPARSITIGDHVWMGVRSVVSKGAVVPDDCIVGAMSMVNRAFDEEGTVIAGVPARVVERGITWHRRCAEHFAPNDLWINRRRTPDPDAPEAP